MNAFCSDDPHVEAFFRAVWDDDLNTVAAMLDQNSALIRARDYWKAGPLHFVISTEMTEFLLSRGAVDFMDDGANESAGSYAHEVLELRGLHEAAELIRSAVSAMTR